MINRLPSSNYYYFWICWIKKFFILRKISDTKFWFFKIERFIFKLERSFYIYIYIFCSSYIRYRYILFLLMLQRLRCVVFLFFFCMKSTKYIFYILFVLFIYRKTYLYHYHIFFFAFYLCIPEGKLYKWNKDLIK